jgi:hypothetical protein
MGGELACLREQSEQVNIDLDRKRRMSIAAVQNEFKATIHELKLEYESLLQAF